LKHLLAPLACCLAFASTASAQLSDYLGPGVLTGGAGNIGTRSGEQVDLRYFAGVNGIYDNGIQPISVNSKGELTQVGGVEGIEAVFGAYGSHSWRTALLGLDYRGDIRDYPNASYYDGSDHHLSIGYTYQASKRLYFDLNGVGGTYSSYLGAVPGQFVSSPNAVNQPGLLLFDNRTDLVQGYGGITYMFSPRASITLGGDGFYVHRQSAELIGVEGYDTRARFQYKLSRRTSIGASYQRSHYEFPNYFGNSDINNYDAFVATQLGRLWTLALEGGVFQVSAVGLQTVALDPTVAALLGVSSTVQTFSAKNWLPAGRGNLERKFKTAILAFSYAATMVPGNGVYLTSRSQTGFASYSYTGIRKVAFSIGGGYWSLASVGQGIAPYHMFTGRTGISYSLTRGLHALARYDLRQQEVTIATGYRSTSYRVTLGLAFSPGQLPLSLW
jgi:hypothetical protein